MGLLHWECSCENREHVYIKSLRSLKGKYHNNKTATYFDYCSACKDIVVNRDDTNYLLSFKY